jgi:hypothetical protein
MNLKKQKDGLSVAGFMVASRTSARIQNPNSKYRRMNPFTLKIYYKILKRYNAGAHHKDAL